MQGATHHLIKKKNVAQITGGNGPRFKNLLQSIWEVRLSRVCSVSETNNKLLIFLQTIFATSNTSST